MGVEIERKFLLKPGDFSWKTQAVRMLQIVQGHFRPTPEATVRVRICDGKEALLTIKGARAACSRPEYEYPIPLGDAVSMMTHFCKGRVIVKTRYYVPAAEPGRMWEIDEYHEALEGHCNAELEIPSEEFAFARPEWLGEEITGRREFANAALAMAQKWPI